MVDDDENIHEIPRSVKCKNREKFQKKKKNYIKQYLRGNLPTFTKLQKFHYSQGKNTRCGNKIFSFKSNIKS